MSRGGRGCLSTEDFFLQTACRPPQVSLKGQMVVAGKMAEVKS
jgi:hypothetical protein